jgi:predicted Rossmann fold nucleotide-binding protein DprA/Smf involved in DNA uptake
LPAELARLLDGVRAGRDTVARLAGQGTAVQTVLAGLAELELRGHVRRGPGGRYLVTAQ